MPAVCPYAFSGLLRSLSSFSFSHCSRTVPLRSLGRVSTGMLFCAQNCRQRIKRASYWPVSSEISLVTLGLSLSAIDTFLALFSFSAKPQRDSRRGKPPELYTTLRGARSNAAHRNLTETAHASLPKELSFPCSPRGEKRVAGSVSIIRFRPKKVPRVESGSTPGTSASALCLFLFAAATSSPRCQA